jgi:hypothetical protein
LTRSSSDTLSSTCCSTAFLPLPTFSVRVLLPFATDSQDRIRLEFDEKGSGGGGGGDEDVPVKVFRDGEAEGGGNEGKLFKLVQTSAVLHDGLCDLDWQLRRHYK